MDLYSIVSLIVAVLVTAMLVFLALNSIPKQSKEHK